MARTKNAVSHVPIKMSQLNELFGPNATIMVWVRQMEMVTQETKWSARIAKANQIILKKQGRIKISSNEAIQIRRLVLAIEKNLPEQWDKAINELPIGE